MKNLLLLALTLSLSIAHAQSPKTLMGDGIDHISGYGGFMMQFPQIDGGISAMTGGGGGLIINNTFQIGAYGMNMADDLKVSDGDIEYDVDFDHNGFHLGYLIRPADLLHFGISTKLGWGDISLRESDPGIDYNRIRDQIFVIVPEAKVEMNMTNWFKVNLGVGYQKALGINNFYYQSSDFDGITGSLSFIFGWFK
ncbi:MAG: hypothetical protein JXQ90_13395 [Cyclobacteriaceae bacterium]